MKRFSFIIILFFLVQAGFAQISDFKPFFIGAAIGSSIPSGDFADNSGNNRKAGWAINGLNMNLNFNYFFNRNLGLEVRILKTSNNIDIEELENLYKTQAPTINWSIDADKWQSNAAMGGLVFSFPYSRVNFDLKALWGYSMNTNPQITVTGSDGTITETVIQTQFTEGALAFSVGGGIRLNFSPNVALSANIEHYRANPTFDIEFQKDGVITNHGSIENIISTWNLSVGLGYRF